MLAKTGPTPPDSHLASVGFDEDAPNPDPDLANSRSQYRRQSSPHGCCGGCHQLLEMWTILPHGHGGWMVWHAMLVVPRGIETLEGAS